MKRNWIIGLCLAVGLTLAAAPDAVWATGACCKTDGTCSDVIDSNACAALGGGSFYLGDGTMCATSDCSRSACVLNLLGGNSCSNMSQYECNLNEGYWVPPPATCANIVMNSYSIYTPPIGGQFNISGATLFADFFEFPASTNDFYNIDGDNIYCRNPQPDGPVSNTGAPYAGFVDSDCSPGLDGVDQLAPPWTCGGWRGHWLVQYRSVGSIEGFIEFVTAQLTGTMPTDVPSERGLINGIRWASTGVIGGPAAACQFDCGPPGPSGNTGTPVCPTSIDLASTDVPSAFGVIGPGTTADARWDRKPTQTGYGLNGRSSYSNNGFSTVPQLASLDRPGFGSLNLNIGSPDTNTIFDTQIAWSPVAPIANRGTGKQNVRYSELQHLLVSGRMPNGENLVGATRDTGSGTRNAYCTSLGIDPSLGNGDHVGPRIDSSTQSVIGLVPTNQVPLPAGSRTQPTNCGGSGIMEDAVRSWRLAVGYTGLVGSSRTEGDIAAGLYEMLNVCRDVDSDGIEIPGFMCSPHICDGSPDPSAGGVVPRHPGCSTPPANTTPPNNGYVRANLFTVLDNANPLCGYQIGGLQTLGSRGDPLSGPGVPPYAPGNANPAMNNLNARDYIRNLVASIAAFTAAPGTPEQNLMPGQLFANKFFLKAAVDNQQAALNPTDFTGTTPGFLQSLQDYVRCNNTVSIRDFGSINVAGKVPTRNNITVLGQFYSDGNQNGSYDSDGLGTFTLTNSANLNHRNQTSGDFFYDGARNIKDIPEILKALKNPRKYERDEFTFSGTGVPVLPGVPVAPNPLGTLGRNYLIPEISGDFNGDGNFNAKDIRYFADGLAIDPATGKLNRCLGWELVDEWWLYYKVGPGTSFPDAGRPEYAGVKPPWHPTLPAYLPAWPDAHVLGAAMADIAGNTPSPGWEPTGYDGIVDCKDIDYVYANFGNFANLRYDAAKIDLSADMNGDLIVNQADVDKIVRDILCTHYGDRNLDGVVNAADDPTPNLGLTPAGWCDGDFDGDKIVTASDVAIYNTNLGATSTCRKHCVSDLNGDSKRNGSDVQAFARALLDPAGYDMTYANCGTIRHNADTDANGVVNDLDIPGFVADLLATTPCPN